MRGRWRFGGRPVGGALVNHYHIVVGLAAFCIRFDGARFLTGHIFVVASRFLAITVQQDLGWHLSHVIVTRIRFAKIPATALLIVHAVYFKRAVGVARRRRHCVSGRSNFAGRRTGRHSATRHLLEIVRPSGAQLHRFVVHGVALVHHHRPWLIMQQRDGSRTIAGPASSAERPNRTAVRCAAMTERQIGRPAADAGSFVRSDRDGRIVFQAHRYHRRSGCPSQRFYRVHGAGRYGSGQSGFGREIATDQSGRLVLGLAAAHFEGGANGNYLARLQLHIDALGRLEHHHFLALLQHDV